MRIKDIFPYSLTVIYPQPTYDRDRKAYENIATQTIGDIGKDFELRYRYGGILCFYQIKLREGKEKYVMNDMNDIVRIRMYFKSKEDRNLFKLAADGLDPEVKIVFKSN